MVGGLLRRAWSWLSYGFVPSKPPSNAVVHEALLRDYEWWRNYFGGTADGVRKDELQELRDRIEELEAHNAQLVADMAMARVSQYGTVRGQQRWPGELAPDGSLIAPEGFIYHKDGGLVAISVGDRVFLRGLAGGRVDSLALPSGARTPRGMMLVGDVLGGRCTGALYLEHWAGEGDKEW